MAKWFKDKENRAWEAAVVTVVIVVLYCGLANIVFAWRHPWAAGGHKLHCFTEIVTFQRVTKQDCGE